MNWSLTFFSLVWTMALLWMTMANRSLFTFDFRNLFGNFLMFWIVWLFLWRLNFWLKIALLLMSFGLIVLFFSWFLNLFLFFFRFFSFNILPFVFAFWLTFLVLHIILSFSQWDFFFSLWDFSIFAMSIKPWANCMWLLRRELIYFLLFKRVFWYAQSHLYIITY